MSPIIADQPLGLPKGSVRGILAILVVGATVIDAVVNASANPALTGLSGSVVTYYFMKRSDEDSDPPLPELDDEDVLEPDFG